MPLLIMSDILEFIAVRNDIIFYFHRPYFFSLKAGGQTLICYLFSMLPTRIYPILLLGNPLEADSDITNWCKLALDERG